MNSRFSMAAWLLWLALPFTALDYLRAWNHLPARVAIHFDLHWRANGWTSREGAFAMMLGTLLLVLVTFTITVLLAKRVGRPTFMPWLMLSFFYATTAFVCGMNHWILQYNLNARTLCQARPALAETSARILQSGIPRNFSPRLNDRERSTENWS
jgi:Ni/Fe-hydrogenase subunit HybB-like protein